MAPSRAQHVTYPRGRSPTIDESQRGMSGACDRAEMHARFAIVLLAALGLVSADLFPARARSRGDSSPSRDRPRQHGLHPAVPLYLIRESVSPRRMSKNGVVQQRNEDPRCTSRNLATQVCGEVDPGTRPARSVIRLGRAARLGTRD